MLIEPAPTARPSYPTHRSYAIDRSRDGALEAALEVVIEEVPVALVYNGLPHVVMLATPSDLEDFALGFSLSEGIARTPAAVHGIEVEILAAGIEVHMSVGPECVEILNAQRRNMAGRTGCGLCGTESLEQAIRPVRPVQPGVHITPEALRRAFSQMRDHQTLHTLTGAVHAAGWSDREGVIQLVREDVGRHNALDKLIGVMAKEHRRFDAGFAVITSRASCEMVQKAAAVGMTIVAAISAPTGLAIRLARQSGLTLIGFARDRSYSIYANPQRVQAPAAVDSFPG